MKRPRRIMWTRDERRKKTVKKIGREKLTDRAIAHPVSYYVRRSLTVHKVRLSATAIFF